MKKLFILLLICTSYITKAQNATISFGEIDQCNLTEVYLPIKIDAIDSIGSISLVFSFDTSKAEFIEITNLHPYFSQNGWNGSHFNGSEILFVWYANNSNAGKVFNTGDILFEVKYLPKIYLDIPFHWDTLTAGRCAIADNYAFPLNSQFVSDSIHLLGQETTQLITPPDMAQGVPTTTTLHWNSTDCDSVYLLELSQMPDMSNPFAFTGLTDTFYQIGNLQVNTTYYWRVARIGEAGVPIYSDIFEFNTDIVNTSLVQKTMDFKLYPCPAIDFTNVLIENEIPQSAILKIIGMTGQKVLPPQNVFLQKGENTFSVNLQNIPKGVYRVVMQFENQTIISKTLMKL